MASQAKVNSNGKASGPDAAKPRVSPVQFGRDAIELGELQVRLLVADIRAAMKVAKLGSLMLVVAIALAIATAPLLLFTLAAWLEWQFELTRLESLLSTSLGSLIMTAILFVVGWTIVKRGGKQLSRSREEFRENIEWAKNMLSSEKNATE